MGVDFCTILCCNRFYSEIKMPKPTTEKQDINKLTLIISGLLVVAAFLIGMLYTKVQYLEKGGQADTGKNIANKEAPPNEPTQAVVNVPKVTDQDHVRGDRKARIALIEYSDLECPFCKFSLIYPNFNS